MTRSHLLALTALLAFVAPTAPARADERGEAAVKRFLAVYDRAEAFEGVATVFCRHGNRTTETTYQLYLAKPNKSGFRVLKAPHMTASEGTKLLWFGGPKADVRTRFFGVPITLSADITDRRLCDLRGDTMADLNVVAAVAVLKDPATRFTYLGRQTLEGRTLDRVEVKSPRLLKGIRHEVLGLDAATALPITREMHDAQGLAYKLTLGRFTLDNGLPASAFTLE
jgi:outer membrane lipoprotein-sorting protein